MDLSSVAPNSTPPRLVNSQLVSLPPVGILNLLCLICIVFICNAHFIIFTWNLRDKNVNYFYLNANNRAKGLLGSRDGAVVRALTSHQCDPGAIPDMCHMWVVFIAGSQLTPRVFSGFSGFPSSQRPASPNPNSTRLGAPHKKQVRLMWLPVQVL